MCVAVQTDKSVEIHADIPGVKKEDIQLVCPIMNAVSHQQSLLQLRMHDHRCSTGCTSLRLRSHLH